MTGKGRAADGRSKKSSRDHALIGAKIGPDESAAPVQDRPARYLFVMPRNI
jgi:hypothetical protein